MAFLRKLQQITERKENRRLLAFYVACMIVYFIFFIHPFLRALNFPEVLIAPIMALGSFVAGSTFLGGGAVAFPALTKILHTDPLTAKTFSLAIQSIGMTSASIYIFFKVRGLPYRFFIIYLSGAVCGLAISLGTLEGRIPNTDLRIIFTLFILCFLAVYMRAIGTSNQHKLRHIHLSRYDYKLTLFCGILGGAISGLLGSGADLLSFCLLTLYFRVELKFATQCSVILMAFTSLFGIAQKAVFFGGVAPQAIDLWYIAAPVVLIGAPLGALFCRSVNEKRLMIFICMIVAVEVISTLILVPIEKERIGFYFIAGGFSFALFFMLKKFAFFKHRENSSL